MSKGFAAYLVVLICAGGICSKQALAASDPFFCKPERKEICNYDKPCETVSAGEFLVIIDDATNTYTRCDKPDRATCDSYAMVKSGDYKGYTTFEMSSRGGFSKIGPDGDWAEAVSLGGMIVVSHGMCLRSSVLKK
jgi:hypothetical protein